MYPSPSFSEFVIIVAIPKFIPQFGATADLSIVVIHTLGYSPISVSTTLIGNGLLRCFLLGALVAIHADRFSLFLFLHDFIVLQPVIKLVLWFVLVATIVNNEQ